jgi:hypothetical protein
MTMIINRTIVGSLALFIAATTTPLHADPPVPVDPAEEVSQVPPLPMTPAAVNNLLYALPFTLDQSYESEWRSERPLVTSGWLLVLEVDTACVFPRQTAEPVLYVGNTTAERINVGHESGRIVVIVPSDRNEQGELALDLAQTMMWFGRPGLPEQVDAAKVQVERQAAAAARIAPFSQEKVQSARAKAEAELHVADRASLRHAAAELIKIHSPQETELVEIIQAEKTAEVAGQKPAGK